ncbi:MAG: serine hydrolase [Ignavibacteriaceae bacterium]|nr:serine hydrolase [Ignavibacterium sp.]MCC6255274.1 serine hydrolase [Ignavibacteriaceae bacterium]HRN26036.1 serine hydrolase domain-containing protein [Ignavibacteriaceae bacterium]HRP92624.1 serine hydrolase domain-containing protein [Ignavibacteriaceae bacterium]HRQ53146.1 serine hydrolase domain-containing protein [Ignavibacteriaceae bacterium]
MKYLTKYIVLILLLAVTSCFPQNTSNQFNDIDSVINKAIVDEAFPGAVVLVWKDGKIFFEKSFGNFTYDKKSPEVNINTIYDLASVTKVVATTTAAMICCDRKLFSLDDKVVKYIPEFGVNGKENITIKNLMLHNSGLVAWQKFYERNLTTDEVLKEIYGAELEYKTGEKMVYSDLGIITLGKIIEKVTGKSLDVFCKDEIFVPLKMNSTFYNPADSLKKFCAPTELDNYWRNRQLQGEVHDETSAMLNGVAGHAGLFSTANDISKLMAVLMNEGKLNDKQFIQQSTIEYFTKRYSDESSRAIGWDTKSETGSSAGNYFSANSFGHTGYTGTSIWADPGRNLFVVFLTNRVYPTRENGKLGKMRPELHNTIIKCLEKIDEK